MRKVRWSSVALVAGVSVASMVAAVLLMVDRAGVWALPTAQGACERLAERGLGPTPEDLFCRGPDLVFHIAMSGASLLFSIGLALPGVFLAWSGRRLSALIPLALAPWFATEPIFTAPVPHGRDDGLFFISLYLLVLAAPALAVMWVRRGNRLERTTWKLLPMIGAGLVCAALTFGILRIANMALGGLVAESMNGTAMIMGVFGLLLGTNRKLWFWALVPSALLLSEGPSALFSSLLWTWEQKVTVLAGFMFAFPLFLVGLGWTPFQTLNLRFQRWLEERELPPDQRSPRRRSARTHRRLRPVVVLNAVASGLLVVSIIMARNDPLNVWISTALPTYLGVRDQAQDVRTRIELRASLEALEEYQRKYGSDRSVDLEAMRRIDPTLSFVEGSPYIDEREAVSVPVFIIRSDDRVTRLAKQSPSGDAFCLERRGDHLTYGEGKSHPADSPSDPRISAIEAAIENCHDRPWTASATKYDPLPDCSTPDGNLIICRMVQALIVGIQMDEPPSAYPVTNTRAPEPGEARSGYLEDGRPVWLVGHEDGGVSVLDAVSAYRPWGIGYLVSWCQPGQYFEDVAHGSLYDERGTYLSGPAPSGLETFDVRPADQLGRIDVGHAMPGKPRRHGGASPNGRWCSAEEAESPIRPVGPQPWPRMTLASNAGTWQQFAGTLVIPSRGAAFIRRTDTDVPRDPASYGEGAEEPVRVEGIDNAILDNIHRSRYTMTGVWIARANARTFDNLTYLGPLEDVAEPVS